MFLIISLFHVFTLGGMSGHAEEKQLICLREGAASGDG